MRPPPFAAHQPSLEMPSLRIVRGDGDGPPPTSDPPSPRLAELRAAFVAGLVVGLALGVALCVLGLTVYYASSAMASVLSAEAPAALVDASIVSAPDAYARYVDR